MRVLPFFLALLGGSVSVLQAQSSALRDPEALYLDGVTGLEPVILKVRGPTAVYATRTLSAHVGNFIANDEVILLAHTADSYLVRSRRGKMEGWISPEFIQPLDPALLKNVKAAVDEETLYQNAIKNKEVISGMTFDHVLKSLGKPENKSFREDENGRFDLWSYVEYKTVVEQRPYRDALTGQLFTQSVRVKIPAGTLDIEFKEGRVSAVEKNQSNIPSRNNIRLR